MKLLAGRAQFLCLKLVLSVHEAEKVVCRQQKGFIQGPRH